MLFAYNIQYYKGQHMRDDIRRSVRTMYEQAKKNLQGDSPTHEDSVIVALFERAEQLQKELCEAIFKLDIAQSKLEIMKKAVEIPPQRQWIP